MTPEQDGERVIKALEYLRDHGMDVTLLRKMHHSENNREGYGRAISYRRNVSPGPDYDENNLTYHRRLLYVESEHRRNGRAFDALVPEAFARFE